MMKFLKGLFGSSVMDVTKFKPKLKPPVERYDTSKEWTLNYFKEELVYGGLYIRTYSKIVETTGAWKTIAWSDRNDVDLYIEVFTNTGKEWLNENSLEVVPVPIIPVAKETINQCKCVL